MGLFFCHCRLKQDIPLIGTPLQSQSYDDSSHFANHQADSPHATATAVDRETACSRNGPFFNSYEYWWLYVYPPKRCFSIQFLLHPVFISASEIALRYADQRKRHTRYMQSLHRRGLHQHTTACLTRCSAGSNSAHKRRRSLPRLPSPQAGFSLPGEGKWLLTV